MMRVVIPTPLRPYLTRDPNWLPLLTAIAAIPFAILGWWPPVLLLLIASSVASVLSQGAHTPLRELLDIGGIAAVSMRAIRLAVLLLLGSQLWQSAGVAIPIAAGGILIVLMSVATDISTERLRSRLLPEVFTRNLNIEYRPRPPLARVLATGITASCAEVVLIVTGCVAISSFWLALLGSALAVAVIAAGTVLTDWVLRTKGNAFRARALADIQRSIRSIRPEVALYLGSNQASTAYQLNAWLASAEQIPHSTVVIVRSKAVFDALRQTSLPVVALVTAHDLVTIDLSTLRATLFVANTGDVIHLVREQAPMSAFIGHGDSDKMSSFNPFTKVYDEVWVAGPAGRVRYERAHIGIRTDQFEYVGRPQLSAIDLNALDARKQLNRSTVPTVLYAPTWEGWNEEQAYCSLLAQGVAVVQYLLACDPPVRIVYKPHPFTGIRHPGARAASAKIEGLLRDANLANGLPAVVSIPRLTTTAASAQEQDAQATANALQLFANADQYQHVVVGPDDGLGIFQCFEQADAMVTDISSVLSDFVYTDRPYAVCNPRQTSAEEFVREFPSTGGGYVIGRDCDGIDEFANVIRMIAPDSLVPRRRQIREDLLGPSEPSAEVRFNQAVDQLVARANERIEQRDQQRD